MPSDTANTTDNSAEYMLNLMNYSKDQVNLLQRIFRHKLVHLAQPSPAAVFQNKRLAWRELNYSDRNKHLEIIKRTVDFEPIPKVKKSIDAEFVVSIIDFEDDITRSVSSNIGYLKRLRKEKHLQKNFERAIGQIYNLWPAIKLGD